jgi:hypothetical protein
VNPSVPANPAMPTFVVEGERDADNLAVLGVPAVSVAHGANMNPETLKWSSEWTAELHNVANVAIIADDDSPQRCTTRASPCSTCR